MIKMQKKIFAGLFVLVTFFFLTGCSAKKSYRSQSKASAEMPVPAVSSAKMMRMESADMDYMDYANVNDEEESFSGSGFNGSINGAEPVKTETVARKLIYTGNVSVQVESLAATEKAVSDWASSLGGYITNSYTSSRNLTATVRIPANLFSSAMDSVSSFGNVENRSISTEDVTDQYYDLQTRLDTRKILRDRLQDYLKKASSMEDLLSIESELNNVQSDVEVMEGQFKRLSNRIDFSTISINAYLPYNTTEDGFIYPDMGGKLKSMWSSLLEFLASFVIVILGLVLFGVPVLALVAVLYWLCFGRIGLLRKLFSLLSRKKK